MSEEFDLVVIGAGPGGYVAAIRAGQLGLKVACIEKFALGGTCLNVGCIPSKILLHWTEILHLVQEEGPQFGLQCPEASIDWSKLQEGKARVISQFQQGVKGLCRKAKVTLMKGQARFVSSHMVEVKSKDQVRNIHAKNILIASGSYPMQLPFLPFDEKKVLSSTSALSLEKVPETMTVIGGGVIGLELASVYNRLGTKVTIVEMLDQIATGVDEGIGKLFQKELERQGLTFHLSAKVTEAETLPDSVSLQVETKQGPLSLSSDVCLVSVGRGPNTKDLDVENAGFSSDEKGFIPVNGRFQTGAKSVWAIGDAVEGPMLAHRAEEEAIAVAELLAGKESEVDYSLIPNIIYTSPEVAGVGITEQEGKELGLEMMIGSFPFKANSRASCMGGSSGIVKVIGHKPSGRLIGMHIMGPSAGEMIHEGVIAMKKQALVADIAHAPHGHPTLSEAVKEAAMAAVDKPIHM